MRILLVEDSESLRRSISRALRHVSYAVDLAADGEEGLAAAEMNDPTESPVFTNPLTFTNAFAPFRAGALKVFAGSDQGSKTCTVDIYLSETRSFIVSGATVACAVLREVNFADGVLIEVLRVGKTLPLPRATFTNVIKVRETTQVSTDVELKWYAAGVGVVQARAQGELLRLVASTLVQGN